MYEGPIGGSQKCHCKRGASYYVTVNDVTVSGEPCIEKALRLIKFSRAEGIAGSIVPDVPAGASAALNCRRGQSVHLQSMERLTCSTN